MDFNIRPMHIGQVIREIREARRATLEEVAFAANTNASNLSRIERGVQGYSAEMLERIAQGLGVTVAELHLRAESSKGTRPAKGDASTQATINLDLLASRYGALTPENCEFVDELMALLLRRQRNSRKHT